MIKPKSVKNDNSARKLCVFASYHKKNLVDDFIYYHLRAIRSENFELVFVSNSKLQEIDKIKLSEICRTVIEKENTGLDFSAYKEGLTAENYGKGYSQVILTNVSIYGPLFPLKEVLEKMSRFDFWGLTENFEIAYHIQSYFLSFNHKVTQSEEWRQFWDSVTRFDSKEQIIEDYEVGLSRKLILSSKFNYGVYLTYTSFIKYLEEKYGHYYNNGSKFNLSLYYWDEIVEKFRFPYFKKTLVDNTKHWNSMGISVHNWKEKLTLHSTYPIDLILQAYD